VTQLEFLSAVGYLRERTPDADNRTRLAQLERDFLERHLLNWVSNAQEKLAREDPPIFTTLMTLLLAFVQSRVRPASGDVQQATPVRRRSGRADLRA
jgi:TorA maturation chaperone TorD